MKLNDIMEFDHVIHVDDDGNVTDAPKDIFAPEVYEYGGEVNIDDEGWRLLDGWSRQDGYSGPVMHPSELIGRSLESAILETPGLYVVVAVYDLSENEEGEYTGWAVAYREDNREDQ